MQSKPRTPEETYGPALRKARSAFPMLLPREAAVRAGISYQRQDTGSSHFRVPFMNSCYRISWPEGLVVQAEANELPDVATQILLLHYLLTADGTPVAGQWISFRNLSGGLGYFAAFQGRANLRLAQTFGHDQVGFEAAAKTLSGERLTFGDASFLFRVLPRVWIAVVLNLGDEEFSANANVLFDAAASHYLPTEDLAVLGGILAGRLIRTS